MIRIMTLMENQPGARKGLTAEHGLSGTICPTVVEAVKKAQEQAGKKDMIFIGGSNFIVADALPLFIGEEEKEI